MGIRRFQKNDFPDIHKIYALSKLDELSFEKNTFTLLPLEQDKKRFSELIESDIYVYAIPKVIAYGAIYGSEIRSLFVSPSQRSRGIGKALLEYLLGNIKGEACLSVAKSNSKAKALYQAYGFTVVDEFTSHYNGIPVLANKMLRPVPHQ